MSIRVNLTNLNALLIHIELARPNKDAADEFIDRWMQKFLEFFDGQHLAICNKSTSVGDEHPIEHQHHNDD